MPKTTAESSWPPEPCARQVCHFPARPGAHGAGGPAPPPAMPSRVSVAVAAAAVCEAANSTASSPPAADPAAAVPAAGRADGAPAPAAACACAYVYGEGCCSESFRRARTTAAVCGDALANVLLVMHHDGQVPLTHRLTTAPGPVHLRGRPCRRCHPHRPTSWWTAPC